MTAQHAASVERITAPPTRFSPAWLVERFQGAGLHVAVIALTAAWMVPAVGLLVSSFRPFTAITSTGWWTALAPPFNYTLDNYAKVLSSSNLGHSLFNSFMISIPATVIPAAVAAFAAYAFSWMKFPGRNWLFLALVGLLAVPLQLSFVPVLKVYNAIGLTPTNWGFVGVWLAHTGYGLPFAIYLLANFFRALPSDLFESAEIDGAGTLTVFFRIVLPLSVPALASLIIFQFLWVWNDFLVALIYVGGAANVAPVTVTLANLTNSLGQGYHLLTAAAFISMIIPLVVFVSLQRYFVRGILAGSVKG
jgi:alpha-glucoside transport system permease protein